MGHTMSCLPALASGHSVLAEDAVEMLAPGDVVWISGATDVPKSFMVRDSSGWNLFATCGVVIANPQQPDVLQVLLPGPAPASGQEQLTQPRVQVVMLSDLLAAKGLHDLAFTALHPKLEAAEMSQLHKFAAGVAGTCGLNKRCQIVLSGARRVFVTECVAEALVAAGRAVRCTACMMSESNASARSSAAAPASAPASAAIYGPAGGRDKRGVAFGPLTAVQLASSTSSAAEAARRRHHHHHRQFAAPPASASHHSWPKPAAGGSPLASPSGASASAAASSGRRRWSDPSPQLQQQEPQQQGQAPQQALEPLSRSASCTGAPSAPPSAGSGSSSPGTGGSGPLPQRPSAPAAAPAVSAAPAAEQPQLAKQQQSISQQQPAVKQQQQQQQAVKPGESGPPRGGFRRDSAYSAASDGSTKCSGSCKQPGDTRVVVIS